MARAENGPLGPLKGKVSNLIFSTNLGTPYVKSNPGKRSRKSTKEQNTHNGFAGSWEVIKPLKPFLKISYSEVSKRNRGLFAAISYLLRHAVDRDAEGTTSYAPSRMLMSRGSLGMSAGVQVELVDGELQFSWDPRNATGPFQNDDQALLVAHNPEAGAAITAIGPAFRRDGSATLSLNELPPGKAHVYLGFISYDRSKAADSVYLGEVEVL